MSVERTSGTVCERKDEDAGIRKASGFWYKMKDEVLGRKRTDERVCRGKNGSVVNGMKVKDERGKVQGNMDVRMNVA